MEPLHVLHAAPIRWFNAEVQYALDLALELQREGFRVSFFGQTDSLGVRAAREAGLRTFEEQGFNAKGLGFFGAVPAALRFRRLLRAERVDAVEVHRPEGLPLIAWACAREGAPCIRVRGDMRPVRTNRVNRYLYRRVLAGVVATNAAVAGDLQQRLGSLPRLATIHGGVDERRFRPDGETAPVRQGLGLGAAPLLVGILGRVSPVKGHEIFLEAARQVLDRGLDARFVVLAKGEDGRARGLRERVVGDPQLSAAVHFLGHREDLPAVLRAFDLGVVASVGSEANCRVGLEWMASGIPLIASRVGVLPDLVAEGESGLLVPAGDSGALAAAVARLAADRDLAHRLGLGARRQVLSRFTLGHCARAHAALLHQVAGPGFNRHR